MKRLLAWALVVCLLGAIILALQVAIEGSRALFSYTASVAFGVSICLGGLLFVQIIHAAHVVWALPVRRLFEAMAGAVPLYLLLFVPMAAGYRVLYPWARPETADTEDLRRSLSAVHAWMNGPLFVGRAYVYLLVWSITAWLLRRASIAQDGTGDDRLTDRQRAFSAGMIPALAITLTFAAFDWFMSLVPAFASDMYGVYFFAGSLLGALALGTVVAWGAGRASLLPSEVGTSHVSALGRLLLMSVILWTYIGVGTLILIWIADLPHEIIFLSQRVRGSWALFSGVLVVGHFVAPFVILLLYGLKRRAGSLALMGAWLVLMHAVDAYWLVVPSLGAAPHILDIGAFLFVGGLTLAFGTWMFSRTSPYPLRDPNFSRALRYESE